MTYPAGLVSVNIPVEDPYNGTKWFKSEEQNGPLVKVEVKGKAKDMFHYLLLMSPKFLHHRFIERNQAKQYEDNKKNATHPSAWIAEVQMDFSEN